MPLRRAIEVTDAVASVTSARAAIEDSIIIGASKSTKVTSPEEYYRAIQEVR